MKSIPKFILFVSCCLLFIGCASKDDVVHLPSDLGIPDSLLNKDLRVTAPANWNDFEKGDNSIVLEVTLATNKQIVTAPDFNAKMYLFDSVAEEWEKINNLENYKTPPDEVILHQGDVKGLALLPDLSRIPDSKIKILILVSGNVIENGEKTDQLIGTYIILYLEP